MGKRGSSSRSGSRKSSRSKSTKRCRRQRSCDRSPSRSRSPSPPPAAAASSSSAGRKVLKHAALGNVRRLRELLAAQGDSTAYVNSVADGDGATALHRAARHGQLEAVQLLLRRRADAAARDGAGNTPGHLAAMHGHWLVLTELIQAADIDLEAANAAGLSVRDITHQHQHQHQQEKQQQQEAQGGFAHSPPRAAAPAAAAVADSKRSWQQCSGDGGGGSDDEGSLAWSGDDDGLAAAERAAGAAARAAADEAAWREKLRYEMGYDLPQQAAAGSWGAGAWDAAAAAGAGSQPQGSSKRSRAQQQSSGALDDDDDDDDGWADRLWQDMQQHQRQAAAARAAAAAAQSAAAAAHSFGKGPSREDAARERQRRAAAAAKESARILREEQGKDANWRAAMMRQVEEAALPLRRSSYEDKWRVFEAVPASRPIRFQDVPWPCPTPATQAAAVLQLDAGQLRTLVLAGAASPADIKAALRKELMRWHPDKFTARWGARLAEADRDAIQAGVHAVAQQLTGLKQ